MRSFSNRTTPRPLIDRGSLSGIGICSAAKLSKPASLRISAVFGQSRNVMFCAIYDIIAKVAAAQRFPAWMLLVDARKCHEMCGYVTFCEILGVGFLVRNGLVETM